MECTKCKKTLKIEEGLKCAQCQAQCHYQCFGLSDAEFKKVLPMNKAKWKCVSCKHPKSHNSPKITLLHSIQPEETAPSSMVNIDPANLMCYMDKKFDALAENFTTLKKSVTDQLAALTQKIGTWESRIQKLEAQVEKTQELSTIIENRDKEIASLNTGIQSLQEQLNVQEQSHLRNELEIAGIIETENENLHHIIGVLAHKIGLELHPSDVDRVTRVGPKSALNKSNSEPRCVVVRFIRNTKRNDMINAARVRKHITTEDLDIKGTPKKLYFNERLTKANRSLFREARIRAKQAGYRFTWVKNGCIYVRREKEKSPKQIHNIDDVERILGPPPMAQCTAPVQGRPTNA